MDRATTLVNSASVVAFVCFVSSEDTLQDDHGGEENMMPIRMRVLAIALSVAFDSADKGRAAFAALVSGGTSGFNTVLGGNRANGQYARLEAHGVYWTASDNDSTSAPYYNFGQGGQALHRQPRGNKQMAISVRCVRE